MRKTSLRKASIKRKERLSTKRNSKYRKTRKIRKPRQMKYKKMHNQKRRLFRGGQAVGYNQGEGCTICFGENIITGPNTKCLWNCTPTEDTFCHRFCDECIVTWVTSSDRPLDQAECPACRAHIRANYIDTLRNLIIPDYLTTPAPNHVLVNQLNARIVGIGAIAPPIMAAPPLAPGQDVQDTVILIGIAMITIYALRSTPDILYRLLLALRAAMMRGELDIPPGVNIANTAGVIMLIYFLVSQGMQGGGEGADQSNIPSKETYYLEITGDMLSNPKLDVFAEVLKKYPDLQEKDILSLTINTGVEFTKQNESVVAKILSKQ
uniref:RING-type domain-containing protein n=1 Tax=viral metagenome TaxID=1070528 RepID=A0A6C0B078_9ZZZZ